MTAALHPAGSRRKRLQRDTRGSVTIVFVIAVPAMLAMAGAAVDYSQLSGTRAKLQAVADAAALAGAREFRLSNAIAPTIAQSATSHAQAALGAAAQRVEIAPTVDLTAKTVTVQLTQSAPTVVLKYAGNGYSTLRVRSTAKTVGGSPVCVVGLDDGVNATVEMDKSARLEAPNCAVYSNSTKSNGLVARNSAVLRAAFICSAGGKSSPGPGSFVPEPQIDCPIIPDPLLSRPLPSPTGCISTAQTIKGGSTNLTPGTYCDGLVLTDGAKVTLSSGTYIFQNGGLTVTGNASMSGSDVTLHFTGNGAKLKFDPPSSISLNAPRSGTMAGILISEDRNSPAGQTHEIYSDDARMLLGTIYLPRGRLHVAANKPVADMSAYTIVVARTFSLSEGPIMYMNTNYSSTDVPVPDGVGPGSARTQLTR